jgi:uncharacterized Zn-finger protein
MIRTPACWYAPAFFGADASSDSRLLRMILAVYNSLSLSVDDTPHRRGQLAIVLNRLIAPSHRLFVPPYIIYNPNLFQNFIRIFFMAPPRQSPPLPSPAPTTESVSSFVPRPFPPPSLVGVPHEYIVDSLRRLAPQYWNDTETADCSIGKYSEFSNLAPTLQQLADDILLSISCRQLSVRCYCSWTECPNT